MTAEKMPRSGAIHILAHFTSYAQRHLLLPSQAQSTGKSEKTGHRGHLDLTNKQTKNQQY